jgi:hypothetical protein
MGSSTAVTTAVTEPESNSITTITVPAHVDIIAAIPPRPAATSTIGIAPTRIYLTDGFSVSNLVTQITDGITKNLTWYVGDYKRPRCDWGEVRRHVDYMPENGCSLHPFGTYGSGYVHQQQYLENGMGQSGMPLYQQPYQQLQALPQL